MFILIFQFDEKELTDYKDASESGINPYPIYAAVDKEKLSEAGASSPGKYGFILQYFKYHQIS